MRIPQLPKYLTAEYVGYYAVVALIVYGYVYKFPVACYGCESEGIFLRCMGGTGEGSNMCSAFKLGEKRVKAATGFVSGIIEDSGAYLEDLWTFTKEDLPPIIWEFIEKLKVLILAAKDKVKERMEAAMTYLREKITDIMSKAKDLTSELWQSFKSKAIDPVLAFVLAHIVSPLVAVADALVKFKNLVWKSVSEVVAKFANLNLGGFVDDIQKLFAEIPESIKWLKEHIIKVINVVTVKSVDILNSGINLSLDGIEVALNSLGGGVETIGNGFVSGLNGIKNGMANAFQNSMEGITSGVNLATSELNKGLAFTVEEINTHVKEIQTGIEIVVGGANVASAAASKSINDATEALVDSVNDTSGKIEKGVNTIVKDVNRVLPTILTGVNKVASTANTVVNTTIGRVNTLVGAVDKNINTVVGKVNTALDSVDSGVNTIVDKTESIVNANISKVNSLVGLINNLRDVDIKVVGTPFNNFDWWPEIKTVTSLDLKTINSGSIGNISSGTIGTLSIGNVDVNSQISNLDIPEITAPTVVIPSIPEITFTGVNPKWFVIPPVTFPQMTVEKDIEKVSVGKIQLPSNVVPHIDTITVDDVDSVLKSTGAIVDDSVGAGAPLGGAKDAVKSGVMSALTWIPSKISEMKEVIAGLFETVMKPIHAALVTVMTTIYSIWAAIQEFWGKYLTVTAIKERINLLLSMGRKLIVDDLIHGIIIDEVVPGFVAILENMKDVIVEFAGNAAERLWDFLGKVGNAAAKLFGEVYKVVVKVTSLVAKNVLSVAYYAFGTGLDRATWFVPVSVTIKIMIVVTIIVYMFIGGFLDRAGRVLLFAKDGAVKLAQVTFMGISTLDYQLDLTAARRWSTAKYLFGPAAFIGFNPTKVIAAEAATVAEETAKAAKAASFMLM